MPILWPVRQIRWFPYIAPSVVERLQATLSMPLNDRGISDYICSSVSSIPYVECLAISPDLVKNDIDDATAGTSTSDIIDWKKT